MNRTYIPYQLHILPSKCLVSTVGQTLDPMVLEVRYILSFSRAGRPLEFYVSMATNLQLL